jgi:hypothetical protein
VYKWFQALLDSLGDSWIFAEFSIEAKGVKEFADILVEVFSTFDEIGTHKFGLPWFELSRLRWTVGCIVEKPDFVLLWRSLLAEGIVGAQEACNVCVSALLAVCLRDGLSLVNLSTKLISPSVYFSKRLFSTSGKLAALRDSASNSLSRVLNGNAMEVAWGESQVVANGIRVM